MECLQTNARQRKNFLNGCKECERNEKINSGPDELKNHGLKRTRIFLK